MIVILTGAKKNVGDYLIGSRARKLLREFVDDDIVELDRFSPLDTHIPTINKSRAVILCGGPAYTKNIFPKVYPLTDYIEQIKVPIIPFGLGWSGKPFGSPDDFRFDDISKRIIDDIHKKADFTSCRDIITENILQSHGHDNILMTGCPVWYDLDSIGKELDTSLDYKRIVFTTPASRKLVKQNKKLMKVLRNTFPSAEIICSFHRGILPDKHTGIKRSIAYMRMTLDAKKLGFKVVDTSFDLQKIGFYKDLDLHVGYRVHAHLDFISRRKPSILINEDGRGQGMVESMNLPVLNFDDQNLIESYESLLTNYKVGNFSELLEVPAFIDKQLITMKKFLASI